MPRRIKEWDDAIEKILKPAQGDKRKHTGKHPDKCLTTNSVNAKNGISAQVVAPCRHHPIDQEPKKAESRYLYK